MDASRYSRLLDKDESTVSSAQRARKKRKIATYRMGVTASTMKCLPPGRFVKDRPDDALVTSH